MKKSHIFQIALFFSLAGLALANPVELVTLNTSSLDGTTGSIDFEFDPATAAQNATATIFGFNGVTYLSGNTNDDGASGGPIPSTITINNTQSIPNDNFEAVTFSNTLSFEVEFSGPAISTPNGAANSQNTFFFSVFTDTLGSDPASSLTTDPNGIVGEITISNEGALSTDAVSPEIGFEAVPEPGALGLLGCGLMALGVVKRRRK